MPSAISRPSNSRLAQVLFPDRATGCQLFAQSADATPTVSQLPSLAALNPSRRSRSEPGPVQGCTIGSLPIRHAPQRQPSRRCDLSSASRCQQMAADTRKRTDCPVACRLWGDSAGTGRLINATARSIRRCPLSHRARLQNGTTAGS